MECDADWLVLVEWNKRASGGGGTRPFPHTNLGSNSLVRRKLRMGAKTVGSLSMKICMVGEGHGQEPGVSRRSRRPSSRRASRFRSCPTHSSRLILQS